MKFARDILLIDIESTGIDPVKDFPLQLAAVLLDKDNLLEKKSFNSFIKHPFSQTTNDRIVQTLGISKEFWMKAPNLKTVIASFKETFPYNVTIASQNIINVNFFTEAFKKTGIAYEYDYHIIELWTLGYMHLSRLNLRKIPTAQTVGSYFKLERTKEHDALANCRFHAEILRKLSK
jgi:DNA polymerase III alpha subunit (gram-positive type)